MANEYQIIAQENTEAAIRSNERENDEDNDEELLTGKETPEQQAIRNALFFALKDTRGEPGLSIKEIASQVMNAFDREEVHALVKQLSENLDA